MARDDQHHAGADTVHGHRRRPAAGDHAGDPATRERSNRQINGRLRTLIAAYKVPGGSFTDDLTVDPRHLRDLHRKGEATPTEPMAALDLTPEKAETSDRARRIRDAV